MRKSETKSYSLTADGDEITHTTIGRHCEVHDVTRLPYIIPTKWRRHLL